MEEKKKFKKWKKILLIIIGIILLIIILLFTSSIITRSNVKKFKDNVSDVKKNEVSYVIVEINPKLILEIQNNIVIKMGCLNNDCVEVFKDVDVINKELKETITFLYDSAIKKISVSNGVTVSSSNEKVEDIINDVEYAKYIKITPEEEQKSINEVIDNNDIKSQTSKLDYNEQLLEEYKKDKDYDKLYNCKIQNAELACYITEDFYDDLSKDLTIANVYGFIDDQKKLMRVLDKFDIEYKSSGIEGLDFTNVAVSDININGTYYKLGSNSCYNNNCNTEFHISTYDRNNTIDLVMSILPFKKFNLATASYNNDDVIILDNSNGAEMISNE